MVSIECNQNQKPWVCPTWLKTDCPKQLGYRLRGKEKTVEIPGWDNTRHDKAKERLATRMKQMGFQVRTEYKIQYEFENFVLAHWFDIIGKRNENIIIVEVKPRDLVSYQLQYDLAQLLASKYYGIYSYFVYQYKQDYYSNKMIHKPIPDLIDVINNINDKIQESLIPLPVANPGTHCLWCPYTQCEYQKRNAF